MVLEVNGWKIFYHPVFGDHYNQLRARARELKETLSADEFKAHSEVKLLAAVKRAITEVVPTDPNRADFWLRDDLAKFRRVKGFGLPDRCRLFYVFSSAAKTVIYLYLNDAGTLRKEGARTDPYAVFADLVDSGKLGDDYEANYAQWLQAQRARRQD